MSSTILDLSNVINITIQPTPENLAVPNVNTAGLITQDQPSGWGGTEVFRIYKNATDVGTDFGTGSNTFILATAFFAQQPNPLGTNGYLAIIPRLIAPSLETIQNAIVRTLNSVFYFGVLIDEQLDSVTFGSLTAYIQTLDKILFYASSIQADYAPGGILDQLRTSGKTHTRGLYYNDAVPIDTQGFAAAYCARGLSTDFTGSATTQTMNLKVITNFSADPTIDQTQLQAAFTAGVDVYVDIAGLSRLFTSGANGWFDEIYNELWFKFALQTAGFNFLSQTATKIPQTEAGMEALKNAYRQVCQQAVTNGFIGPGTWNSPDVFGNPANLITAIKDIGFYVYSNPLSSQSEADRQARLAPLVQIAVKTQGAIHKSNVIVNVNL